MQDIFFNTNDFQALDSEKSFGERLKAIHQNIGSEFPFIHRIAVILYDQKMDTLTTFLQSSAVQAISCYTVQMGEAPSLDQMKTLKKIRVVNDLSLFSNGTRLHTRIIADQGYRSSCAIPMFNHDAFIGVIFFNAFETDVFTQEVVLKLIHQGSLINCLITTHMMATRMLVGAFRGALDMVSYKDPETGNHLERMARYAKLIAQNLSRNELAPFLTNS